MNQEKINFFRAALDRDRNIIAVIPTEDRVIVLVRDRAAALEAYGDDEIEYRESKPFEFYQNPEERARPFFGGYSVGHYRITAGTASLMVKDKRSGKPAVLSNNHVLANINTGRSGDPILQPGSADGGRNPADIVARLHHFEPIRNGAVIDAAVADLTAADMMELGILGVGNVYGIAESYIHEPIWKFGRTSRLTRGDVSSVNASIQVGAGTQVFRFDDVIISEIPSAPGDSGSAILDFSNNYLVGLLFAGNGQITAICKATHVFQLLDLELYPPESVKRALWLDVSQWQGNIDFSVMKSRGVEGVIIKAAQGGESADPNFAANYAAAKAAGLKVGAYIFLDFTYNAYQHYDNLARVLAGKPLDIPVALDCEQQTGRDENQVAEIILGLSNLILRDFGKRPMIYTSQGWWNGHVAQNPAWSEHPLWIANWNKRNSAPAMPRDWQRWHLWQHQVNKNGAWFGVGSPEVDMNVAGEAFRELLGEEPPPPPPPPERTTFPVYKIRTTVNLNYRSEPRVSATRLGKLPVRSEVYALDEQQDADGNIWVRIGYNQWCARVYNGNVYAVYL